jgi:hypothetical protein
MVARRHSIALVAQHAALHDARPLDAIIRKQGWLILAI